MISTAIRSSMRLFFSSATDSVSHGAVISDAASAKHTNVPSDLAIFCTQNITDSRSALNVSEKRAR